MVHHICPCLLILSFIVLSISFLSLEAVIYTFSAVTGEILGIFTKCIFQLFVNTVN